jgi:transposase
MLTDWGIKDGPIMSTLLPDDLWETVEPLLPVHPRSPKGGAPRCDDRDALEGILYVLRGGIPWRLLPKEFGVSPTTCWRRFHEWSLAGVWDNVHRTLLRELGKRGRLDTSRLVIDSTSVRALKGGRTPDRIRRTAPSQAVSGM